MNMKFAVIAAGLTLAISLLSATSANAIPAPAAMRSFCASNAGECIGGGRSMVTATPDLMTVLKNVNRRINGSIRYTSDRGDSWQLNPSRGDCEDYALSKRSALIKAGVAPGALRIAMTFTRRGVPHAVLVVKTSDGDYVLDNLNNNVKPLARSGYNILAMSTSNPLRWGAGS
jgi:predicted transglutaminase-like cysteine proteinase